mmetsp:Transcript_2274/g.3580  ORF Transcript_2274/g.3580 Transcript_2274/m.3580 type:complete len:361 (+) Transcript_2274:51-1133(+)
MQRAIRVAAEGATLSIHEYGTKAVTANRHGQYTPVLFSHPTGFHGRVYDSTAAQLLSTGDFRPFSFDHRGHGRSFWEVPSDTRSFTWDIFGEDVTRILYDTTVNDSLSPIIGVGHSMGATALVMAAVAAPEKFKALVLYEPVIPPPIVRWGSRTMVSILGDQPMAKQARKRRTEFPSYQQALQNFSAKRPMNIFQESVVRDYVAYGLVPIDEPTIDNTSTGIGDTSSTNSASSSSDILSTDKILVNDGSTEKPVKLLCDPDMEALVYNTLHSHDTWEKLSQLTVPTWIVRGRIELWAVSSITKSIFEQVPRQHGTFVSWPAAGHFGPMQFPQRFADLIVQVNQQLQPATTTNSSTRTCTS